MDATVTHVYIDDRTYIVDTSFGASEIYARRFNESRGREIKADSKLGRKILQQMRADVA